MPRLHQIVNSILSGQSREAPPLNHAQEILTAVCVIAAAGAAYGGLMGTYSGVSDGRGIQILYSAIKVPLLLGVTFGLSLPGFFVLNTLFGLRTDLSEALSALLSAQAGMTIILLSMAPLTVLWYASSSNYYAAILVNAALFGIATLASQRLLRARYLPLIRRDSRHRVLLRAWLATFGFVGIQMGWLLRPFVGSPLAEPRFMRADAWGNAYEVVFTLMSSMLRR